MKIVRVPDYKKMSLVAADVVAATMLEKPDCVLGLATGSTPEGMYEKLVQWNQNGKLDFSKVSSINLDEYVGIDPENEQSYRYFMNHHLFDHVNVDKKNTYVPDGQAVSAEEECKRYEQILEELGGVDIQVLGMGHNGHIGFNEPGTPFHSRTHVVDLQESTIEANKRFFESAEDVPKQAFTMGIETILSAKKILLMVSGEAKAETLKKALSGPVTPEVPASVLQTHGDVVVIADEAALSKL